jgi:hypothetical protein
MLAKFHGLVVKPHDSFSYIKMAGLVERHKQNDVHTEEGEMLEEVAAAYFKNIILVLSGNPVMIWTGYAHNDSQRCYR